MTDARRPARVVDPRAIRVVVAATSAASELEPIVVAGSSGAVMVDGEPARLRLDRRGPTHVVLVEDRAGETRRTMVVMLPEEPSTGTPTGAARRELIVDGWRIEVEIESEQRAALRERARRGREGIAPGGRTELRAVIPGRIMAVSITPGDRVVAGQQVLVIEAMKMQNELRAPRDGVVGRVEIGPGQTVELGDLLLVLE